MWIEIWAFFIIVYAYNNLQSARCLCYKQSVVFSLCTSLSQSPCLENKVFAVSLALYIMVLLLIASEKCICCSMNSTGAQGYSSGLLQAHLPRCLHRYFSTMLGVQRNYGIFYFLESTWKKKKKAQGQSTLRVHQDHLGVGDVSPPWIWQLRVENGKEMYLAPFQESTKS